MGAMDGGIVAPAITSILADYSVEYKWGIWTVTIYTLVYAVSMPIVGKLADIYGRQKVFIYGVATFAVGSFFCVFSNGIGQLIVSRAIQAIGGGGIIPIATAEISQSFPAANKGFALGLVGAVFGIAMIISPNVGSLIIETLGWEYIFLINLPISLLLVTMALRVENRRAPVGTRSLDWMGALFLSLAILGVIYALTNLNPTRFFGSLTSNQVWPFLIVSAGLLVPFVMTQKTAKDPIVKTDYFRSRKMAVIMLISFIGGINLVSTIFIPAFAENLLGWRTGTGGYVVTILAVSWGLAAGIGGRALDLVGPRPIIISGFAMTLVGSLVLALFADGMFALVVSLLFMGAGIGFTMGAPLNYLIIQNVPEEETLTGFAILALFRTIGSTLGPTMLVAFVTRAVYTIPEKIQKIVLSFLFPPGGAPGGAAPDLTPAIEEWNNIFGVEGSQLPSYPLGLEAIQSWLERFATDSQQQFIIAEIVEEIRYALHLGYKDMFLAAAAVAAVGIVVSGCLGRKADITLNETKNPSA